MAREVAVWIRRSAAPLAACALLTGVLAWMAFDQGGYFEDVRMTAAVVVWSALALLCLVELPRTRLSTPALAALGALALLTSWTALSTTWSLDAVRGERLVDLSILYLGIFAVALFAVGTGRHARIVLIAALGACGAIMAAAVWARLHPGALGSPPLEAVPPGFRMDWPLGYWNTLGGLGAMGGLLAVGLAADPRSAPGLRAPAAGVAVLCLVGAYLTFSRGTVLAFGAGVIVLFLIGAHRASLIATFTIVGVAFAALVLRLEAVEALTTDPFAGQGQRAAGEAFTPVLLTVMGLAAGAQAIVAAGDRSVALADLVRRTRRPLAALATAVVVVGAVGAYVVRADAIEGRVATALDDGGDWLSRQWDEFNRPGVPQEEERGSARLDTARGGRSDLWRIAIDGFEGDPLRGAGAGSYQVMFFQDRDVTENVQNAHSLPLETAGELGIVGAGLLLLFLGAVARAVIRSRRTRLALPTTQTAAAGAAVTVWLVHASVDWDWQMPAFSGLALMIAATVFPSGRRRTRRRGAARPPIDHAAIRRLSATSRS